MSTGSPRPPSTVAELALRLGAIGDRPEDDESERLRHRLLVFMGVLMSVGGLLWGSLAMWFGLWMAACIPYAYVVITALNLLAFRATKRFSATRTVQVLASLLLPFLFQWSLGGFESSGAVMLWAMLALVGSLTFSKANDAIGWIVVYAILTAASGLLEPVVHDHFSVDPAPVVRTTFFVINVVTISSIVFGLTIYILFSRESTQRALTDANARVTELNEQLEDLNALSRQARVIPHYRDGKPQGFKIVGVRPGSLYSQIGVRSGDILKSVNGEEISSPNKALELYEKLKNSDNVAVDVERRGRKVTLDYQIK